MATVNLIGIDGPSDEEELQTAVSESEFVTYVDADSSTGTLEVHFAEGEDEETMADDVIGQIRAAGFGVLPRTEFFDSNGQLDYE